MQDDLEIKISMLLDGELDQQEAMSILGRIKDDSALRAKWLRYNAVSCAFKQKPASLVLPDAGFFDRVSQALDNEPVPLATDGKPMAKSLRMSSLGFALAASIAVLGIIIWPSVRTPLTNFSTQPPILSSAQNGPGVAIMPTRTSNVDNPPSVPRRFKDYLITHNGSTYTPGAQTMIPYARVVSYSSDR